MSKFLFKNMPASVRREIEIVSDLFRPYIKKNSKYIFFAMPLLTVSMAYLVISLVTGSWYLDNLPSLAIYALLASLGFAFYKESKHVRSEMEEVGMNHMIERITKSQYMDDNKKKEYIRSIKEQPKISFEAFLNFLNEEDQYKRSMFGN
ncbi:hypothetical protein HNQ94_000905 [Salirhabdus euzebyi]|uniref:YwnF n=1 Tax=Salirhabdus euzebyi TaxID=394506 RepID=A0A841PUI0_9BACI|nr:DUF5392 family protein [Salirhabdus euzebyi]MBB6452460.1 hypothetical protein [Salirhabdus euzebyi]